MYESNNCFILFNNSYDDYNIAKDECEKLGEENDKIK